MDYKLGMMRHGGAHRWHDNGRTLTSRCGMTRARREVDFNPRLMWPICAKCSHSQMLATTPPQKRKEMTFG